MGTKLLFLLSLLLLLAGGIVTTKTLLFISNSDRVTGEVLGTDYYRGPPRSPRSSHVQVTYENADHSKIDAEVAAPFLRKYRQNDLIPLLVSRKNPSDVRPALLSELWAWPLSLLAFGLGILVVTLLSRRVTTVKPA